MLTLRKRAPLIAYVSIVVLAVFLLARGESTRNKVIKIERAVPCLETASKQCSAFTDRFIESLTDEQVAQLQARLGVSKASTNTTGRIPRPKTGKAGRTGAKGSTGATGATGATGKSVVGPSGPKGDKGNTGANGKTGSSGKDATPVDTQAIVQQVLSRIDVGALVDRVYARLCALHPLLCK